MRLTCPNCNAQYEVADNVIPKDGRDVQCSACGHTWFQYPLGATLRMRAEELDDGDDAPATDGAGRPAPQIDRGVLNVLREEAEREITERRRARANLETQGDLGLKEPPISRAGGQRYFGEDAEAPQPPPVPADVDDDEDDDDTPGVRRRLASRRSLLPDIEELSSTLEPGSERRGAVIEGIDPGTEAPAKSRFSQGLSVALLVGAALVLIYILAPLIVSNLPFKNGIMRSYVGLVDSLRAMLAGTLRSLLGGA